MLDVDRYEVDGRTRDMVIAVRELRQSGLPEGQRNWANEHTVYTHGYGVVAAYGNQRDRDDQAVTGNEGKPVWAERDLPPKGDLTDMFEGGYQPRIYFGENSPDYSIVGRAPEGKPVELDLPEVQGSSPKTNTFDGKTGVPIGGIFNKLMYAIKFSEPNIVLSSRVNENSQILYDRAPRERVQKVAPWLTVDGDAYPAVVDGRVKWILDGYTTTDQYPNSQKDSLRSMTSDALSPNTTYATLPTDEINYMRNSVKAVVDAYDGSVTLYEWDTKDPILKAWKGAFGGVVKPKSEIPPDLLDAHALPRGPVQGAAQHARCLPRREPEDVLRGQRQVEGPGGPREQGEQAAAVPAVGARRLRVGPEPVFSLTSVYVPQQAAEPRVVHLRRRRRRPEGLREDLRILRLPSNTQVPGPSQIANHFGADSDIQDRLLAFTRTNSKAVFGNLLTLPVGDGLLYVQPLYTLRKTGEGRYPVLRYVLVSFGEKVGIGSTLTDALDDVLGISGGADTGTTGGQGGNGGTGGTGGTGGSGGAVPSDVRALLQQAERSSRPRRMRSGTVTSRPMRGQARARDLVQQALAAAGRTTPSPAASPSGDALRHRLAVRVTVTDTASG